MRTKIYLFGYRERFICSEIGGYDDSERFIAGLRKNERPYG
jgi:hypothetical protein